MIKLAKNFIRYRFLRLPSNGHRETLRWRDQLCRSHGLNANHLAERLVSQCEMVSGAAVFRKLHLTVLTPRLIQGLLSKVLRAGKPSHRTRDPALSPSLFPPIPAENDAPTRTLGGNDACQGRREVVLDSPKNRATTPLATLCFAL